MKGRKTSKPVFSLLLASLLMAFGARAIDAQAQSAKQASAAPSLDARYAKISASVAAKLKGVAALQPSNNLDELYGQAEQADKQLRAFMIEIAKQTRGEPLFAKIKSRARSEEKVKDDYGGNAAHLLDIARGTIKFDRVDDLYRALQKIDASNQVKVVRIKDRFAKPAEGGYRDLLVNLRLPSGFITELQLNLSQIMAIKKQGHQIYRKMRALDEKVAVEKRDFTAAELEQKKRWEKESEALYDRAFQSALNKEE